MQDQEKKPKRGILKQIFGGKSDCCCGVRIVPEEETKQNSGTNDPLDKEQKTESSEKQVEQG